VVDAKRLLLGEHRADDGVDRARALEVVAERLFEDDADIRRVEPGRAEVGADDREELGLVARNMTTTSAAAAAAAGTRREPCLQPRVVGGLREIDRQVVQQRREARELVVARPLGVVDFGKALLQPGAVASSDSCWRETARMRPPSGSLPCRHA
jgi:hypothetical protein